MFRGSIVALVTPFKPSMEVDFDVYGRLIDRQIEAGTHGIAPCGCTGEAVGLAGAFCLPEGGVHAHARITIGVSAPRAAR